MSMIASLPREAAFMLRERAVLVTLLLALLLSCLAVTGGVLEVRDQQRTIKALVKSDAEEREHALSQHRDDWGSVAYYSFHLTYDPPSPFAFAALGQRDSSARKHRVRMLAIEGQIYERDAGNPVFAMIGRFDFAFVATFVLPLLLIALLHDLRAGERAVGRHNLLMATAASGSTLWWSRAVVRAAVVYAAVVAPLIVGALVSGSAMGTLLLALLQVALYVAFWTVLIVLVGAWRQPAGAIASALLGAWLLLAVLLPAAGRVAIDRLVEMPAGADILLTQREAVNDAWDLPKEATMTAFLEREPQLRAFAEIKQPFEWKWYYAFQQVGDQKAESLAQAYRDGRERRDALAQRLAWLSPPALMERSLQRLARTDMQAVRAYEDEVRSFHAALRAYYYPPLFKEDPVDDAALSSMPLFVPRESKL